VNASVLRLLTRLNIGGPARQALLLTRELGREFPTVLAAGFPTSAEGELSDPAVPVHRLPLTRAVRPHSDVAALAAVRKLLLATGASLLHTHMAKAGTIGRVAASLLPVRPRTVHTFHGHVLDGYFSRPIQRVFLATERQLARRTDALVAVSPEIRDALLDLGIGSSAQFHVMPVGVDLEPYLAVGTPTGQLRAELGVDWDVPLVGTIGRLVPIKDHATLIRAINRLPRAHLVVAGDGELRSTLRAETARMGLEDRIHFVGWRNDLPTVLADIDVVALTSLNEGTPVALIEALAACRPVVATDVGGVRHVVHDGKTGLLAPARDDETFATRLAMVLSDAELGSRLARAGRADVILRFGQAQLINATADLYRTLIPAAVRRAP